MIQFPPKIGALVAVLMAQMASAEPVVLEGYAQCVGADFAQHQMDAYRTRFPHDRCTGVATCDAGLMRSATEIAAQMCRAEAVKACDDDTVCIAALTNTWSTEADRLEARVSTRLAPATLDSLPPLQKRRLSQPVAWTISPCDDPASATCAVEAARARLTAVERWIAELDALEP